ncbi:MAG: TonB family protein [Spirochaetia bacterium]|nr:TonB family protein [Spirochaetia bacterium]
MTYLKPLTASLLIHLSVFLAGYYALHWWKHSGFNVMDIDLTSSELMLRPSKTQPANPRPLPVVTEWYMGDVIKRAAIPVKITQTAEPVQEPVLSCPPPCPQTASDWASTASTSKRPVWVEGLITEDDYPQDARAQGREGRVKVEIYIDAQGTVRDVRVIQSSDERFTAVVREKLAGARFEPALDTQGRPVAVRMAVPIVFQLH